MEERIPLTARTTTPHARGYPSAERNGTIVDEGSRELLEHLIAIVLQGNTQYLETLLQNEEILEVVDMHDNKGFTALHIASERVDTDSVRLLLEADANPNVMDRFRRTALHWLVSGGCHCDFCDTKRARCVELLLRAKGNLEIKDVKGETPLSYAVRNSFHKVVEVMIEHGAEIHQTCNEISTASLIIQKVPEVMTHLLDQSVAYDNDDNSKLKVDFKVLLQAPPPSTLEEEAKASSAYESKEEAPRRKRPKPQPEMAMVQSFLKCSPPVREALLTHPVTAAFLHLKWGYVRKRFWFIRCFYTILAILYTYFIFKLYLIQCPYNDETGTQAEASQGATCDAELELFIVAICIASWVGFMLVSCLYTLVHSCRSYCTTGLNLGRWVLIGMVTLNILPAFGILNEFWQWQYFAAAFGVFYTWILTLWHLSQLPVYGAYIRMFAKVLQNVIVVIIAFSSLVIAFAFGFAILFPKSSYFKNIPMTLLRLFLLMMGDREYGNVFNPTDEPRLDILEYSIGTHLYYLAFIVVFGIAVTNLLIALAVRDVRELDEKAEFVRLSSRIEGISQLESLVSDNWILNCIQNFILTQISVYCRNGRYFRVSPMDPDDKTLPAEIKMKFVPLLHTRDCLHKREMLAQQQLRQTGHGLPHVPGLQRNDHFRGSNHSHHSIGRPSPDNIDEILIELKQKLEGLQQQRRRVIQRSNPIFC